MKDLKRIILLLLLNNILSNFCAQTGDNYLPLNQNDKFRWKYKNILTIQEKPPTGFVNWFKKVNPKTIEIKDLNLQENEGIEILGPVRYPDNNNIYTFIRKYNEKQYTPPTLGSFNLYINNTKKEWNDIPENIAGIKQEYLDKTVFAINPFHSQILVERNGDEVAILDFLFQEPQGKVSFVRYYKKYHQDLHNIIRDDPNNNYTSLYAFTDQQDQFASLLIETTMEKNHNSDYQESRAKYYQIHSPVSPLYLYSSCTTQFYAIKPKNEQQRICLQNNIRNFVFDPFTASLYLLSQKTISHAGSEAGVELNILTTDHSQRVKHSPLFQHIHNVRKVVSKGKVGTRSPYWHAEHLERVGKKHYWKSNLGILGISGLLVLLVYITHKYYPLYQFHR